MIEYASRHGDKLIEALTQHLLILVITMVLSLFLAAVITIIAMYSNLFARGVIQIFSVVYSIPSLALFAILIPVTGLGLKTAVIVLTAYNQYLLLRNFISGLQNVDPAMIEAATGMGMTRLQILCHVRLPLAKRALFTGVQLAVVSTIGIATIAAAINAGGLGSILFDGLRTLNVNKILWGSLLSAGLAIFANGVLSLIGSLFSGTAAQRRRER